MLVVVALVDPFRSCSPVLVRFTCCAAQMALPELSISSPGLAPAGDAGLTARKNPRCCRG